MQAVSTSLSTVFTAVIFSTRSSVEPNRTTPPVASSASRSVDTATTASGMRSATATATVERVAGLAVEASAFRDRALDAGEDQGAVRRTGGFVTALTSALPVVALAGGVRRVDRALLDGDDVPVGVDQGHVIFGHLHGRHDHARGDPHLDRRRPGPADLGRFHPRQLLDPGGDRPAVEAGERLVGRHGRGLAHLLVPGAAGPAHPHVVDVEEGRPGGGDRQHHRRHHGERQRQALEAAAPGGAPNVDAPRADARVDDHARAGGIVGRAAVVATPVPTCAAATRSRPGPDAAPASAV